MVILIVGTPRGGWVYIIGSLAAPSLFLSANQSPRTVDRKKKRRINGQQRELTKGIEERGWQRVQLQVVRTYVDSSVCINHCESGVPVLLYSTVGLSGEDGWKLTIYAFDRRVTDPSSQPPGHPPAREGEEQPTDNNRIKSNLVSKQNRE